MFVQTQLSTDLSTDFLLNEASSRKFSFHIFHLPTNSRMSTNFKTKKPKTKSLKETKMPLNPFSKIFVQRIHAKKSDAENPCDRYFSLSENDRGAKLFPSLFLRTTCRYFSATPFLGSSYYTNNDPLGGRASRSPIGQ